MCSGKHRFPVHRQIFCCQTSDKFVDGKTYQGCTTRWEASPASRPWGPAGHHMAQAPHPANRGFLLEGRLTWQARREFPDPSTINITIFEDLFATNDLKY